MQVLSILFVESKAKIEILQSDDGDFGINFIDGSLTEWDFKTESDAESYAEQLLKERA